MMRISSIAAALLLMMAGAQAGAELRDVIAVERGGQPYVWIGLETQPDGLELRREGAGYVLRVEGPQAGAARMIEPAGRAPFGALRLEPREHGFDLVFSGLTDAMSAELREGGIWLSFDAQGPGASPELAQAGSSRSGQEAAPAETQSGEAAAATPPAASAVSQQPAQPAPGPVDPCAGTSAAMDDSPWDLDVLTRHADCLVTAEQTEAAAALYERVLAFEPGHYAAAVGLAGLLEEQGRTAEAARLYDAAASSAITDGEALRARTSGRRPD